MSKQTPNHIIFYVYVFRHEYHNVRSNRKK